MENANKNLMEKLAQEGLLPPQPKTPSAVTTPFALKQPTSELPSSDQSSNFFSSKPFGLTVAPQNIQESTKSAARSADVEEMINTSTIIDGFDTDIWCDSLFKQIDDKVLYLKLKIARLQAELEEHKKITEAAYLKSDKNHHQKLLQIQEKMEEQLKNLVADYQNQQLKSIVVSPFVKAFSYIKNYVALK